MSAMDIQKVMEVLPHRYPFLLVDRVEEIEAGKFISALKNVSAIDPYFQGHFPGKPVMPGVLIVEALAQCCCLLAVESSDPDSEAIFYLTGVDKARFKRPVVPGDQLCLEVELIKERRGLWMFECKALVDGKLVASADIMCTPRVM